MKTGILSGKTKSNTDSTTFSRRRRTRSKKKLMKSGHLEKIKVVDEDCFASPVVITVKSGKSVKKNIRLEETK